MFCFLVLVELLCLIGEACVVTGIVTRPSSMYCIGRNICGNNNAICREKRQFADLMFAVSCSNTEE